MFIAKSIGIRFRNRIYSQNWHKMSNSDNKGVLGGEFYKNGENNTEKHR